jgi:hypothetical protein
VPLLAIAVVMIAWAARHWDAVLLTLNKGTLVASIGYVPAMIALAAAIAAVSVPRVRVWCVESFFALSGCIAANAYFLLGLNRLFLMRGRMHRLLRLK